jgi:hypothetical protein
MDVERELRISYKQDCICFTVASWTRIWTRLDFSGITIFFFRYQVYLGNHGSSRMEVGLNLSISGQMISL